MAEACNMLRFVFLDEAAKRFIDNWPDRTKRLLAEFRLDYGRRFQDSTMTALVRELQGSSPEFSLWWRSEEHTSELQSLMRISYAVFCLKKKLHTIDNNSVNINMS